MSERWGREQVLGLSPDAASRRAATTVAKPASWSESGCDAAAVWGECQGSGSSRYRVGVDLAGTAFRCSCPSRKFPCKHALALLVLWSDGVITDSVTRPLWLTEWLTTRQTRAARPQTTRKPAPTAESVPGDDPVADDEASSAHESPADPSGAVESPNESANPRESAREPSAGRPAPDGKGAGGRRESRVAAGLEEFDRWLRDQVAQGLAGAESARYALWDEAARRLIDAQAGSLAGQVKGLAAIPRQRGAEWPGRLLEEYALLHLLVRAFQKRDELSPELRETVRSRVGFTVSQEEVASGPTVRDAWYVIGSRDSEQDRLITRRAWLRGRRSGRAALVLSFAAPGRALGVPLVTGTTIDADLAFFPGAQPLRALVVTRHPTVPPPAPPPGTSVTELLSEYATALSKDPWLDQWPALLRDVRLASDGHLVDPTGSAVPLESGDRWRLLALSGGGPMTVGGEWTSRGLRALSAWHSEEGTTLL